MQVRAMASGAAAVVLGLVSGCTVEPPPTTIELVNATDLDVRPNLYTSGSASDAAGLFVGSNLRQDFTARPFPELRGGESVSLTLGCEEVASLGVDAPVFFDAVSLTVEVSGERIWLRRGRDFECGATVRFVYFAEGEAFGVRAEFP